jgi:hypothetical protein
MRRYCRSFLLLGGESLGTILMQPELFAIREMNMPARKIFLSVIAALAMTLPAYAQGGGGGGGSGGGAGAAAGGAAGTGGTATSPATTGGTASGNPAANQQSQQKTNQVEESERNTAVSGASTQPSSAGTGTVSAPGVGVGHSANGVPIGMPGSGLGSPAHSEGSTK